MLGCMDRERLVFGLFVCLFTAVFVVVLCLLELNTRMDRLTVVAEPVPVEPIVCGGVAPMDI